MAKKSSRQNQIVESARNGYDAARNAGITTQLLKRNIKELGNWSGLVTGAASLAGGVGPVIRGAINVFKNLITDKSDFFQADSAYKARLKGIVEKSDAAEKLLASGKNLTTTQRQSIIAARIEAIEMTLAYQLTAILQGGTGGRTISDTDVTRTLAIFGGTFIGVEQKLDKIEIVEDFIERAKLRGTLFTPKNLEDKDNAELFNVYSRISDVVNPFSADTAKEATEQFSKFVEKKYVDKIKETLESNTATRTRDHLMAIVEHHAKDKKRLVQLVVDNRVLNNFIDNDIRLKESDGKTLGVVKDGNNIPYVVNMKAFGAWMGTTNDKQRKNVIAKYNTGDNSTGSIAYDLSSGQRIKVQYHIKEQGQSFIDFEAITPDNTGASAVPPAPATVVPNADENKVTNKPQAVNKLFKKKPTIYGGYDISAYPR